MANQYILGIDAGTSLIKSVIFNMVGTEVGEATQPVPIDSPHSGWMEQAMGAVWAAAAATIRGAIANAGIDAAEIAVIAPTGQGDGAWLLDRANHPVRPAMLWNDNRGADLITAWESSGTLSQIFTRGGTTLWPGSTAPLLSWMREHEPADYDRVETILYCKDWVKFKLTGELCTDETDGSIPFMEMATRHYSEHQLERTGLADVGNKLAPIRPSSEVMGEVTPAAASETSLAAGTPVISGMLDVAATAIGLGAIEGDRAFSIIGTTALNGVVMDQPLLKPVDLGATVCHAIPGCWMRVLGSMSGTPTLDWHLSAVGHVFHTEAKRQGKEVYAVLDQVLETTTVGAGGVLFHPYISGERAPFLAPQAKGGFFGISDQTSHNHLLRAVYEGVCLSVRHCFTDVGSDVNHLMLAGGGTNSPAWCQILADVIGCTMAVPQGTQFGAMGAAMTGAVGVGHFASYQEAVDSWVKVARIYEPDTRNHEKYTQLYGLYHDLIAQMQPFWSARQAMLNEWAE